MTYGIVARRLKGGQYVQYGSIGCGAYFKSAGLKLLEWYNDPQMVDYLFNLGQLRFLGKPKSELGGMPPLLTTTLDGMPHYLGRSETEIFSQHWDIDYGYFYDLDNRWYFVIYDALTIKIPLSFMARYVDEEEDDISLIKMIIELVIYELFTAFYDDNPSFRMLINENYEKSATEIARDIINSERPLNFLEKSYPEIYNYLDKWVLVDSEDKDKNWIDRIVFKEATVVKRTETIEW